jgi:hypothetical protein
VVNNAIFSFEENSFRVSCGENPSKMNLLSPALLNVGLAFALHSDVLEQTSASSNKNNNKKKRQPVDVQIKMEPLVLEAARQCLNLDEFLATLLKSNLDATTMGLNFEFMAAFTLRRFLSSGPLKPF